MYQVYPNSFRPYCNCPCLYCPGKSLMRFYPGYPWYNTSEGTTTAFFGTALSDSTGTGDNLALGSGSEEFAFKPHEEIDPEEIQEA